jgi:transcriptional regulator with XRE-family HTH domain
MKINDPLSLMNKALTALENLGLSQKQVAEICNIPESSLSTKRKKYIRVNDKDLVRVEQEFHLILQNNQYEIENSEEIIQKIKYGLHGKEANFFNTNWYMYYWDMRGGLARASLSIFDKDVVTLINVPYSDGRKRDYNGRFTMDMGKRVIVCDLFDQLTKEKHLHIKIAVGQGYVPLLCLGHYSNIHESGALVFGNAIFKLAQCSIEEMLPTNFMHKDSDTWSAEVSASMERFFSKVENQTITLPALYIQNQEQFEALVLLK